jgi:hypothetical protein
MTLLSQYNCLKKVIVQLCDWENKLRLEQKKLDTALGTLNLLNKIRFYLSFF